MSIATSTTVGRGRLELLRWPRVALRLVGPPAVAYAAIQSDPFIAVAARRPGLMAIGVFVLLACMLAAPFRRWLLVSVGCGAAIVAVSRALRPAHFPPALDLALFRFLYPWAWVGVAALALAAASMETISPGRLAAKQLMFASAAVFLIGHGAVGMAAYPNSVSLVGCALGLVCLLGAIGARRLLAVAAPPEQVDDDVRLLSVLEEERMQAVVARRWGDPRDEGAVRGA